MNKTENLSPERAIEILTAFANGSGDYPTNDFETALLMGAEVIRRNVIAKKPDTVDFYGADRFICPTCNHGLSLLNEDSYCPTCGQLLDWSEVE